MVRHRKKINYGAQDQSPYKKKHAGGVTSLKIQLWPFVGGQTYKFDYGGGVAVNFYYGEGAQNVHAHPSHNF